MKKVALTVLMMGMVMNAFGTDQEGDVKGGQYRLPLSDMSNRSESTELDKLYPECSQHIQYEVDEAAKKGRQEGELKARRESALALLAMGLSDEQIMQATRLTAEQLAELKQK